MVLRGTIVGLQVQASSLKTGEPPNRRYDSTPLAPVPSLIVTEEGVCGRTSSGEEIVDVHHENHPASKNRGGINGISVCFTSHYHAMRQHFGQHLVHGSAGENILVDVDDMVGADDLLGGLVIRSTNGTEIQLGDIVVAAPCVEFARFALRLPDHAKPKPDRRLTEAVQFLHHGMRGYYARFQGSPAQVELGYAVVSI